MPFVGSGKTRIQAVNTGVANLRAGTEQPLTAKIAKKPRGGAKKNAAFLGLLSRLLAEKG